MDKIILKINGMTCSACQASLEKGLKSELGILKAEANLIMNHVLIEYDNKLIQIDKIEKKIHDIGFESLGIDDYQEKKDNDKKWLVLLTILSIIILYIGMGPMINLPIIPILDMEKNPIIYTIVSFLLATISLIIGRSILISGYNKLIHKTPNMDTLVGIGVISAYLYSVYNSYFILMGNYHLVHNLYYESAVIVILFIKFGKYIDHKNKIKTTKAIQKLMKLTPEVATIIKDEKEVQVAINEVIVGNHLIAKPGSKIAVDGTVIKGSSTVDESYITGESVPILKQVNDKVIAGSINYDGVLLYKADKVGKDTLLSNIVKLVTEASSTKAPIARIADIISGYFVPTIIIIAIASMFIWLLLGYPFTFAINIFISVLVIACPCALGLATPLSIMIATGISANKGILIKNASALENAFHVKTVIFDKTGTLTLGKLNITNIHNFTNMNNEELFSLIGSLEQYSEHPLGASVIKYCKNKNILLKDNIGFKAIPGMGIEGVVDNNEILIGNCALMDKYNVSLKEATKLKNKWESLGNSLLFVAINKKLVGLLGAKDEVRESSLTTVSKLKKMGIKVVMLTGDNKDVADKIAATIKIDNVCSNVYPDDKVEVVKKYQNSGLVMMVGDGINDSPSLVTADIGVAIGNGTEIAIDSANVVLLNEDLNLICDFIYLSKKTIKNIKENLFWAFFYNILMLPIAMGLLTNYNIILNPMIASFAMTISSITVVLNSLRLRNIKFK